MGKGYLIDSNVIIDFFNGSLPVKGKELLSDIEPVISVISHIEIFGSNLISSEERTKLNEFIKIATIHPVDTAIANATIALRLKHKIKLPDAVIAATAMYNRLTLITRNIADFNIDGINVINPYSL